MTSKVNLNDYAYFLERLQYHIDLDTDEYIEHFGVKGMRWGVRKDRSESAPLKSLGPDKVVTTTKNGTTLTLQKDAPTTLHKTFAKLSKNYRESYSKSANFDITVNDGQKIGTGMVDLKSKDELYLNWIQIDTSARGNGYATAALKAAIDFGKDSGVKKLTLEVPGNAPDARHIYEKLGFKVTKEADETDGVWGGLTEMEYSLNSAAQSSFSRYVIHGIKDVSLDSLRKSKWEVFDPEFAKMIKEEHPDIWDEGGNIKGNDQYEILSKIFEQGGTAKTDSQIAAIELREAWVARHEQDFRLPGVIAQIKWLAVGSRGEAYMKKLVRDEIEKRTSMENSDIDISMEDFLAHFGVKGMQWGVRKDRPSGIQSRSVDRDAAKDASEFARAKMYYGEGAGNRRKLIKAKVEAKSKANPNYKKAFDFHVARQDMSTHADKAMTERSRTDKKKAAKQTGGAVARRLTGEMGTKAAFVALAFTGAAFAQSPKGQALMKSGVSKAKDFVASQKGRSTVNYVSNFMKNQ